ncbi:helix-turn-helix domain-containing protein, partial [Flavobacterium chungangense]
MLTLRTVCKPITRVYNKSNFCFKDRSIGKISPTEESQDELLNIQETSKLLNLSVSTIYSKVCRREIPVNKQGKRIYFYR